MSPSSETHLRNSNEVFGNKEKFITLNTNVDFIERCAEQRTKSITGKCPSLYVLKEAYGSSALKMVMYAALYHYQKMLGIKELDEHQLKYLAEGIIREFPSIKLSELYVFLSDMLCGTQYERFYGKLDTQTFMRNISIFHNTTRRRVWDAKIEQEKDEQIARDHKDVMTYQQWIEKSQKQPNARIVEILNNNKV